MIKTYACFLLTGLMCCFETCFATIAINSVTTTPSTCPNNGTATIYASSTRSNAVFLYNITAGPVTYPQQNDSTFSSLYPGAYTAWVHDVNSFDSTETTFTITGDYQDPEVNLIDTAPLCVGSSSGIIAGTVSYSTGLAPFTWQITSPYTGTPQASGIFNNLPAGNYIITLTDACLVSRTIAATIDTGGIDLTISFQEVIFIGCDTAVVSMYYTVQHGYDGMNLKMTVITAHDTTIQTQTTYSMFGSPSGEWNDTIYNITYGDYITAAITDTCGTIVSASGNIALFEFGVNAMEETNNCTNDYVYQLQPDASNNISFLINYDLTVTVKGLTSQQIVDSLQVYGNCYCPNIPPLDIGQKYVIKVSDYCGHVAYDTLTPFASTTTQPSVGVSAGTISCLDSTGDIVFSLSGFGPGLVLTLNSGPPVAQSTKPYYAYRDTLTYPVLYSDYYGYLEIDNTPAGTYTYTITDDCGANITGSVTLTQVNDMDFSYSLAPECAGQDTIFIYLTDDVFTQPNTWEFRPAIDPIGSSNSVPYTFNISTQTVTAPSVEPGVYVMSLFYATTENIIMPGTMCWTAIDTIVIPTHNTNTIKATNVATCGNTSSIYIQVDSSNNALPFQYEILTGPQTFGLQDSSNFIVHQFGTYTVGVQDACGNVDTRQVTVDTGRFEPVVKSGGWCAGTEVQLSDVVSPYFTYIWHEPNGTVYTGDTLLINPFTPSDTGNYAIAKIVDINGCRDTAYGSYNLTFKDTFQQNLYYCPGGTLYLDGQAYSSDTILYDTLTSAYGCDSIAITIISKDIPLASISPANPPSCRSGNVTLTANPGIAYLWSTASTLDTISVNPSIATTYVVNVTDINGCIGRASVLVLPSGYDSTGSSKSICSGDTFYIGIHAYTQAGTYLDTLTAVQGCDSLVSTLLRVVPAPQAGIAPSNPPVCHTGSITLTASGGGTYAWNDSATSGVIIVNPATITTYGVTVTNANNCTAATHITVDPAIDTAVQVTSAQTTICAGDTAAFCATAGFSTYYWNTGDTSRCISALTAGNYLVSATNNFGCIATGGSTLHIYPDIPISLTVRGDTLTCNNNTTYQWYFNGVAIPGATNNALIAKQSGDYTIEVTDTNGCSYFSTAQKITTGINILIASDGVKLYPNPNTGAFTLEFSDDAIHEIEITDATGRVIVPITKVVRKQDFNITGLADGVYILNIRQGNDTQSLRFSVVK